MNPEMEGFSTRRSSCLLFQMFGVETRSFLPYDQSNGCNLACQGQTRHGGLHPFGNESLVELLKGPSTVMARMAAPLKMFLTSWLWFLFSPRTAKTFFER